LNKYSKQMIKILKKNAEFSNFIITIMNMFIIKISLAFYVKKKLEKIEYYHIRIK